MVLRQSEAAARDTWSDVLVQISENVDRLGLVTLEPFLLGYLQLKLGNACSERVDRAIAVAQLGLQIFDSQLVTGTLAAQLLILFLDLGVFAPYHPPVAEGQTSNGGERPDQIAELLQPALLLELLQ